MKTTRSAAIHSGQPTRKGVPSTLLIACAALLWFGIAASLSAAAPSFADWSTPVTLGSTVNSPTAGDLGPALSGDGLSLYFYSNRGGNFDIWVTQRPTVDDPWGAPANLGPTINTASLESVPAFSADGHWMFFASDRLGGFGPTAGTPTADLYQSYRADIHDDFGWQAPTNLGPKVNTAANESGNGYFENGGAPQLFFGSNRPGGLGGADLYVSDRQADGSWGQATAIPELNSTVNDNRPTVRSDGLEIFFYSLRVAGSVGGSSDLWTATRAATDAPWSTPVNLGPGVNSTAPEQHAYLSADARTLVFSSDRNGGADLYTTTREALLTVTANDQARLFGAANPPLTYAITGFVGGDTSAVVSGTPVCSTPATPSSPGGDYPISCTVGTLDAAGYGFATFVAGKLTVTYTSPCLTTTRTGPLTVSAGEAICIGAGGAQTGPVSVDAGGSLDIEGGKVTGPLSASGSIGVRLCGATLAGPLTIEGSTGLVLVGGDAATGPCAANTIVGPANVTGNTGGVELNGNTITGPLRITGSTGTLPPSDSGSVHAVGNTVSGPVTIQP